MPPTTVVSHTTQLPSVPSATLDQSFSNVLYSPYTNIPPVYYPVDPSRQISSLNVSHHSVNYIPSTQILPPGQLGDTTHSSYSAKNGLADPTCTLSSPSYTTSDIENMDDGDLSDKLPYHQHSSITNLTSTCTSPHHSTNPLDHSERSSPVAYLSPGPHGPGPGHHWKCPLILFIIHSIIIINRYK